MNTMHSPARGLIFIHSTPAALCPHIEWTVAGITESKAKFSWIAQPAEPGSQCSELSWTGRPGTGAQIASALARLTRVRFEVTEEPSAGHDGQRFMYTPALGAFTATVGVHGDIQVSEDRLRAAAAGGDVLHALDQLLGKDWDTELEYFRHASEDAPVRWLHQVG